MNDTKKRIAQAFWQLYETQDIKKITIQDITDACHLYRTTFYNYFLDIYDILEQIQTNILNDIASLDDNLAIEIQQDQFFYKIIEYRKYLYTLLNDPNAQKFTTQFKQLLINKAYYLNGIDPTILDEKWKNILDKTMLYFTDLCVELLKDKQIEDHEIRYFIESMILKGIKKTFQN
ncbi:MAG: TetR/AcrR family transcriptional regulator [Traorella sp.]